MEVVFASPSLVTLTHQSVAVAMYGVCGGGTITQATQYPGPAGLE